MEEFSFLCYRCLCWVIQLLNQLGFFTFSHLCWNPSDSFYYSIDQRLFTLETCCGYGYELARVRRHLPGIFKVQPVARGCRENFGTLRPMPKPILRARRFEGLGGLCRKDNSSQSSGRRLPVASRCHDRYEVPKQFRDQVQEYGPDSLSASPRLNRFTDVRHRAFDQGFP